MQKGGIQAEAVCQQNGPAGKIQVADKGHTPAGRRRHRCAPWRGDVDPVMRLARLAVQDALAAIDAGDAAGDRHVEPLQEIAGVASRFFPAPRGSHRCGICPDAVQNRLWRRHMIAFQPVDPLDVIGPLAGRECNGPLVP